jgi:flavin-binding protein dodecin
MPIGRAIKRSIDTTKEGSYFMSVAKNIEITSTSPTSFEDALSKGIERAAKTIDNVRGAWVKEQKVKIENGKITEYTVMIILTFVLSEGGGED